MSREDVLHGAPVRHGRFAFTPADQDL